MIAILIQYIIAYLFSLNTVKILKKIVIIKKPCQEWTVCV